MSEGRTLQDWLDRADELGAEGRFFEAHEELEAGWRAAVGPEKLLLQGVIQIAAGLHRLTLEAKARAGAEELFERGLSKLRRTRALLAPDGLDALETAIGRVRAEAAAPAAFRFSLRAIPRSRGR